MRMVRTAPALAQREDGMLQGIDAVPHARV